MSSANMHNRSSSVDMLTADEFSLQVEISQVPNGSGKKEFPSGAIYEGTFSPDGEMDGKGKYTYKGGKSYFVGDWKNGQRHGLGKAVMEDGTIYFGEFQYGKRHGRGKKTWPDGRVFIGDWKCGKYDGEGEYTNAEGDTYRGSFKDDKKYGMGSMIYSDGRVWHGEWVDGEKIREVLTVSNSTPLEDIPRHNSERQTSSQSNLCISEEAKVLRPSSAQRLESDFDDSATIISQHTVKVIAKDGLTIKTYDNGDKYNGMLKSNKAHGEGTMHYGDGNVYSGSWCEGRHHGFGKLEYANGSTYEGEWSDGQYNGQGKYYDANGSVYEGGFKNYKKHGRGKIIFPDGKSSYGVWDCGEKVSDQPVGRLNAPLTTTFKYDAFLSHNWGYDEEGRDNHIRVSGFNDELKKRNIKTWFDTEQMKGNILDNMAGGIDDSQIAIIFVTKDYINKVAGKGPNGENDNCKIEFQYARTQKGVENILTVVMEPSCKDVREWKGSLGAALGDNLYYSFTEDKELKSCIEEVLCEIKRRQEK